MIASEQMATRFPDPPPGAGGLKLWSVIVTILGDLLQQPDDLISGPVLSLLIERIGLQPQAMRVALHRLKRDGWVESIRIGRVGYYRPTQMARVQIDAVKERVYGRALTALQTVTIVMVGPDTEDPAGGHMDETLLVPLDRRTFLVAADVQVGSEQELAAKVDVKTLPQWVLEQVAAEACAEDYEELIDFVGKMRAETKTSTDVMQRVIQRIVVLHHWRRLVLRSNCFAEAIIGDDGAPVRCRRAVLEYLDDLKRPEVHELQYVVDQKNLPAGVS